MPAIENTVTGVIYGGSSVNLDARLHAHGDTRRDTRSTLHMQGEVEKYGSKVLTLRVLQRAAEPACWKTWSSCGCGA